MARCRRLANSSLVICLANGIIGGRGIGGSFGVGCCTMTGGADGAGSAIVGLAACGGIAGVFMILGGGFLILGGDGAGRGTAGTTGVFF